MIHASYAYPTHLVILLDFLLVVLLGGLLLVRGLPAVGVAVWVEQFCQRLGRHPRRAVLFMGLVGAAGNLLILWVEGPPVPNATDEQSYILAADTFASGRLTNPSHPMWRHFGTHVLNWPTYSSKYPPAQGLLLALGQVLGGLPAFGLCLASGLLAAGACWMFLVWLPPRWAVFGAILVLLRLAVGGYWNQSYWGGSIAALGGALVFGSLRRLMERPSVAVSVVLAMGLALLANSRPYEGFLLSLPAAWLLLSKLWLSKPGTARALYLTRVALPIGLVLALMVLAMTHYNRRVTGDPWMLPHLGYTFAYNFHPEFVFQNWRGDYFPTQLRAPDWTSASPPEVIEPSPWFLKGLRLAGRRFARSAYFFLGAALVLPVFFFPPARRYLPLAVACLLVVCGNGLSLYWFPHYAAPMMAPLYVLALVSLRRLRAWRWRQRRVARSAVAVVLGINLALFLVQLPAHRPDDYEWHVRRAKIQERLEELPGKHLVLMLDPMDWLHNASDIDASRVVWARDLGGEANRELLEYFHDRQVWRLDRDEFLLSPFDSKEAHPMKF